MLKIGTTFSGIGAPEQALKNLGITHEVLWACDIDKYAKKTYLANHTCKNFYDDITKIGIDSLEYVDLYAFGFPCQDVSLAGKMDLLRGRTALVDYSIGIINKVKPKYFLFENVRGLLQPKFREFFNSIIDRLSVDYVVNYQILNSKKFGVPQNRERVFCVGVRKDLDKEFSFKFDETDSSLVDILQCETDIDKKYRFTQEYLNKKLLQKRWGNRFGTINTKISNCLCAIGKSDVIHLTDKLRWLTPRECARLQGFSDDFKFVVADSHLYKQFGNTITVNVLKAIFSNLLC